MTRPLGENTFRREQPAASSKGFNLFEFEERPQLRILSAQNQLDALTPLRFSTSIITRSLM